MFYLKNIICEGKFVWFKVKVNSNILCNVEWFYDGNLIISFLIRFIMMLIRKDNDILFYILYIVSV